MFRRTVILLILVLCSLGMSVTAGAASNAVDTYGEFINKLVSDTKKNMSSKVSLPDKRKIFSSFKKTLIGFDRLKLTIDEQLNINGLEEFVDIIDEKNFQTRNCMSDRTAIVFNFSPRNDEPEYFPLYIRDTLAFLDLFCGSEIKSN
ncbi:MAG: hypothetical protein SGI74_10135 [Oligoflexia bacterium]|nr:hypothetical protein [Oligoflexia bacterium]